MPTSGHPFSDFVDITESWVLLILPGIFNNLKIFACTHVHTHTYTHAHIPTLTHVHTHARACTHIHTNGKGSLSQ